MSAEQQQIAVPLSENFNALLQREDTREWMEELVTLRDILPKFYDFALAYIEQQPMPESSDYQEHKNYWDTLRKNYIATFWAEAVAKQTFKNPAVLNFQTAAFIIAAKINIHAPKLADLCSIEENIDLPLLTTVNLDQLADEDAHVREWFLKILVAKRPKNSGFWPTQEMESYNQIMHAIENNEKFSAGIKLSILGNSYHEVFSSVILKFLEREDVKNITAPEYFDYLAKKIRRHDECFTLPSSSGHSTSLNDTCIFNPYIDYLSSSETAAFNFIFWSIELLKNSNQPDADFKQIRFISKKLGADKLTYRSSEKIQLESVLIAEIIHKVSRDTLLDMLTVDEPDKKLMAAVITRYFGYLKEQHQNKTQETTLSDLDYLFILQQQYNFSSLGKIENLSVNDFILPTQKSGIENDRVFQMIKRLDPQQQHEILEMNLARNSELINNAHFFNAYLESLMHAEYNHSIAEKFNRFHLESFGYESHARIALSMLEGKIEASESDKQKNINILAGKFIEYCFKDGDDLDNLDKAFSNIIKKMSSTSQTKNQIAHKVYNAILCQYPVEMNNDVVAASSSASSSQTVDLKTQSIERWVNAMSKFKNLTMLYSVPNALDDQIAMSLWRYFIHKGADSSSEHRALFRILLEKSFHISLNFRSFIKDSLLNSKDQCLIVCEKLDAILESDVYSRFLESLNNEQCMMIFDRLNREDQLEHIQSHSVSADLQQYRLRTVFKFVLINLMSRHPQAAIDKLNAIANQDKIEILLKLFVRSQGKKISPDLLQQFNESLLEASLHYFMKKNDKENSNRVLARLPREIALFKKIVTNHPLKVNYLGMLEMLSDLLEKILSTGDKENFEWLLSKLNFSQLFKFLNQKNKFSWALENKEAKDQEKKYKLELMKNILQLMFINHVSLDVGYLFLKKIIEYSNLISFNLDQDVSQQLVSYYLEKLDTILPSLGESDDEQLCLIQDLILPTASNHFLDPDSRIQFTTGYFDLLEKHNLFDFMLSQFFKSDFQSVKDEIVFYFLSSIQFLNFLKKLRFEDKVVFINSLAKHRPIEKVILALCETVGGQDFLIEILAEEQRTKQVVFSNQNISLEIILSLAVRHPTLVFNDALMKQFKDQIQSSDFKVDDSKILKTFRQLAVNGQRGEQFNELGNYILQKFLEREPFDYYDIKMFFPQLTLTEENKKSLSRQLDEYLKDPESFFSLYDIYLCYIKHGVFLSDSAFQSLKAKFSSQYENSSDLAFYNFLVEKFGIDAFKLKNLDESPTFSIAISSDNPDEIKFLANHIKILFQKFSNEQQEFFVNLLTNINPMTQKNLIHQMVIAGNLELLASVLQIEWRIAGNLEPYSLDCNSLGNLSLDDDSSVTPLAMAIICNATNNDNLPYVEIANALLTYQKNTLNCVFPNGSTALQLAAKLGDLAMVKMLVEHKNNTDKNATLSFRARLGTDEHNAREYTALDFAIDNGHVEVVKYLIENGCDYLSQRHHMVGAGNIVYSYPIERATQHPEIFSYFLTLEGIDINKKFPTYFNHEPNLSNFLTLLKYCINHDNLMGIKQLLDMGVDINEQAHLESRLSMTNEDGIDYFYGTYLMYAIKNLKIDAVKLLLSYYPRADGIIYKNDEEYKTVGAYIEELQQAQQVQEDNVSFTEIIAAITSDFETQVAHLKSSVSTFCEELESEKPFCEFSDDELNLMAEFSGSVKYKNAYERLGEQELHVIHKQSIAAYLTSITQEISLRKNSFEAFFTEENCQLLAGLMARNDERAINFFNEVLFMSGRSEDNEPVKEDSLVFAISEQCAFKLECIRNSLDDEPVNIADFDLEKINEFHAQLFEQHINLIHLLDDKELPLHVMIQIECESSAPDVNNLKALVDKLLHEAKTSQSRINWQALKQKLIHLQATWSMPGDSNQVQGNEALTAIINRVDEHIVMKAARMRMRDISTELYAFFAQRNKKAELFKKESEQLEASSCNEIDESRLAACSY